MTSPLRLGWFIRASDSTAHMIENVMVMACEPNAVGAHPKLRLMNLAATAK